MCPTENPFAAPTEGAFLPSTTGCCVQQAADVAPDAATGLRKLLPKSLAAKPEHRVPTNQTFAFWKALTDRGLAHCIWWEQQIWNALSYSEAKLRAPDFCPPGLVPVGQSTDTSAQSLSQSGRGWQEHTCNKEPELSSSSGVFFLFRRGSLGWPELTVQLLFFQSK